MKTLELCFLLLIFTGCEFSRADGPPVQDADWTRTINARIPGGASACQFRCEHSVTAKGHAVDNAGDIWTVCSKKKSAKTLAPMKLAKAKIQKQCEAEPTQTTDPLTRFKEINDCMVKQVCLQIFKHRAIRPPIVDPPDETPPGAAGD